MNYILFTYEYEEDHDYTTTSMPGTLCNLEQMKKFFEKNSLRDFVSVEIVDIQKQERYRFWRNQGALLEEWLEKDREEEKING